MDHFKINQELVESVRVSLKEKGWELSLEEAGMVVNLIGEEVLYQYVDRLISQAETILEINPSLTEKEILQALARNVVEFLGAEAASIRIYDPDKEEMISFGAYPWVEEDQEPAIPFEDSIAGEVVRTHRSYFVPNIFEEEKYKNKEKVQKRGIHSMLAVPISIPRFSIKDLDTEGCLQIYFREEDKAFTPLEGKIAEMLSRRVM
jgi:GAF domain-containing protein